jgi:uncharacterized NAD-dependent epimerase/dehydratase family protein
MTAAPEGSAIVYCEGAYGTTNGKTAHGLVRRTHRYKILSVVDGDCVGEDAGRMLDGKPRGIPVHASIPEAFESAGSGGVTPTHLVVGLAPDGGRLPAFARRDIEGALKLGLNVDSGLHDFLSEDEELSELAAACGVTIRDIRKPPDRKELHFFSGKIEEVESLKVAVLGTDSAVGKRTTAWLLVDAFNRDGVQSEFVGTGQTAWLQGATYTIVMDSLVNDFVAGEIEHVVWSAWHELHPQILVIEGQGSLMNPAYPGGMEILAAARPDVVVLQHAPARKAYDGFPRHALHPLELQIEAIELLSGKSVVAVTVNDEGLSLEDTVLACAAIQETTGRPACAPLRTGVEPVLKVLKPYVNLSRALVERR